MAEIDYQMALLLQHRFEQEYRAVKDAQKSDQELARQLQEQFEQERSVEKPPSSLSEPKYKDADQELARQLQEQFEQEQTTETPSSSLVYKLPKAGRNSSKSLVDPSWELVDPTPDIHNLFMVFNERFFWNKLLAVCVSWSKKMTSCAGVCSYSGRAGMCRITLSEPLLKLRPRKDFVETLLHEMIHAYLFVTRNNKDRDGHGPEFHKHMYRINKETGTNITVYHDFHDEVRLYQQHWWRCNGPCQFRKPFFGMVRRANNRAPGPNDRWWPDHLRNCGGTFIKVREPEKTEKKPQAKITTSVKTKDIRDFVVPKGKSSDSSNIKGFKDLTNQVKGKYNSSSTIVVTKNANTNKENTFKPTVFNAGTSTSSTIKKETATTITNTTNVTNEFISVRNHWANKFNDSQPSAQPNNKRSAPAEPSTSSKVQRVSECVPSAEFCECPACGKRVLMSDLNSHLDTCLNQPSKSSDPEFVDTPEEPKKECPLCFTKVASSTFDIHVERCIKIVFSDAEEKLEDRAAPETFACLVCGKNIVKTELNSHLDECMVAIFDDDSKTKIDDVEAKDDAGEPSRPQFNCPFCMKLVDESQMKDHLDLCLNADRDGVLESLMDDSF